MMITTLEQAARHLLDTNRVNLSNMTVEGEDMLDACGYQYHKKNVTDKIKVQIEKHGLVDGKDFTIDKSGRWVYHFTMNAANHVLLAAMTEKGKEARQQAIDMKVAVDSVPMEMVERMMAGLADKLTELAGAEIAKLAHAKDSEIKERNELIIKKSQPVSLTKILGNSHKVVQAANLWLEEAGYQTVRLKDGKRNGWTITDNGRDLGSQVSDISIFWVPDVKRILPPVSELLDYAERLGLKDMKQGGLF